MASGINHIRGTVLLAIPAGLLAAAGGANLSEAVACSAGCVSGILLSPDLDISRRTRSEYLVYRYMGRFLGAVWFAFWWLYGRLIAHRSPLSHFPIIGTLGRLLYIYALGGVLWYGATWALTGSAHWIPMLSWLQTPLISWALIGLVLSDTLHYMMDFLPFWR